MMRNSREKQEQNLMNKDNNNNNKGVTSGSTRSWSSLKDPRIVRVSRLFGGKDRHSKVSTVRGLRDRRVRLSVSTAIQLYDLQDRLGLNQPSKVVDWLIKAAQHEIDKLPPLQMIPPPSTFLPFPKHHHHQRQQTDQEHRTANIDEVENQIQQGVSNIQHHSLSSLLHNAMSYTPFYHYDPSISQDHEVEVEIEEEEEEEDQEVLGTNNYFLSSSTLMPSLLPSAYNSISHHFQMDNSSSDVVLSSSLNSLRSTTANYTTATSAAAAAAAAAASALSGNSTVRYFH